MDMDPEIRHIHNSWKRQSKNDLASARAEYAISWMAIICSLLLVLLPIIVNWEILWDFPKWENELRLIYFMPLFIFIFAVLYLIMPLDTDLTAVSIRQVFIVAAFCAAISLAAYHGLLVIGFFLFGGIGLLYGFVQQKITKRAIAKSQNEIERLSKL